MNFYLLNFLSLFFNIIFTKINHLFVSPNANLNSQVQDRNCDNEIEWRVNFLCDGDFIPVLSREGRSCVCLYQFIVILSLSPHNGVTNLSRARVSS